MKKRSFDCVVKRCSCRCADLLRGSLNLWNMEETFLQHVYNTSDLSASIRPFLQLSFKLQSVIYRVRQDWDFTLLLH